MKKTLIAIILILIIGGGACLFFSRNGSLNADISGIKTPDIKMPFQSGIDSLEINTFDIGVSPSFDLFSNMLIDTDLIDESKLNLNIPSASVGTPEFSQQAQPQPDESVCSQFDSASSCLFVPEQYRDLCNQCKAND